MNLSHPINKHIAIAFLLTLFSFSSFAVILHVPTPYATIQSAVSSASNGDTILLSNGTYHEQVQINQQQLTLAGEYLFSRDSLDRDRTILTLPDSIRIDTSDQKSVVRIHKSSIIHLAGLTIRDGLGTRWHQQPNYAYAIWGGCLFADSSSIVMEGCRVTGGVADAGGGFCLQTGSLQLTNCVFDSNSGNRLGNWSSGALFADTDTLHFSHDLFIHNTHPDYAGAFQVQARMLGIIDTCFIIENTAGYLYGGMLCFGITQIHNNEIIGNVAPDGAGFSINTIAEFGGDGEFSRNVVQGNHNDGNNTQPGLGAGGMINLEHAHHWIISNNQFENNVNNEIGEGALILQEGFFTVTKNKFLNNVGGTFSSALRFMAGARGTVDSCVFSNNTNGTAFSYNGFTISLHNNDFSGNTPYAIVYQSGVDLQPVSDHNWWGDSTGPSSSNNANGRGDSVDYRIPYSPWLTAPVFPTTGVAEHSRPVTVPSAIELFSNYPNPFNSTTKIRFSLPNQSVVDLRVFDVTGREVSTTAHRSYSAGMHTLSFDGSRLSSGLYFLRINAGKETAFKKMMLVK